MLLEKNYYYPEVLAVIGFLVEIWQRSNGRQRYWSY
jgi:hypothetical protein